MYYTNNICIPKKELQFFTPWGNIKITLYQRPRVKFNFLQNHTITPAKILCLEIDPHHPP